MAAVRHQPRGLLRLDRTNLLTRGLRIMQAGTNAGQYLPVNGASTVPAWAGYANAFAGASSQYLTTANNFISPTSLTFLAIGSFDQLGADAVVMGIGASTNNRVLLYKAVSDKIFMFSGAGSTIGQATGGPELIPGRSYVMGGRVSATNNRDVWLDGVKLGANTSNVNPAACNRAVVGAQWANGTPSLYMTGRVSLALTWDRALSDAEMESVSMNPWQVFFADEDDEETAAPVIGGSSLAVTPAALLLGGGEVGLRTSRRVAVQAASLAATGGAIALKAYRQLGVQPTALAVSGGNVGLRAARRLAVDAATLALTAGAAQLHASRRLSVALAPMAAAGGMVQFEYTPAPEAGSYAIPVSPAALAIAGGPVSMRVSRQIRIQAASVGIAAQDVRFSYTRSGSAIDASLVPASRTVVFGGGVRTVIFNGGLRVAVFSGGSRIVRF